MPLFEIAFHGQVRPGVTAEQARARIGQLFQVGDEQLNVLFSGRRVVIKQGLDEASADKYRQAIERAGAVCSVDSMEQEETPAPVPSSAASAAPSAPPNPAGGASLKPRDAYMAAFSEVEAPDFGIAPVGADMQDEYEEFVDLPIDLSALSLAPAGSDLEQLRPEVAPVKPNIDHLRLQD
ncbi:hypothetical protein [Halopseudomonas pelagia]|uniref:Uncharacterized protein n=1 Tax=Halopseudomonas pelagia TaxID=553151 RepID=A0AA91Z5X9_9GAMM|nr:hypothetical protein [Halopseudomonas pelagia]PCC99286.1 hypothetical protein CO192_11200 [Halopseudomonas pelagia]QFY56079.1 hypothetical protein EAO82_06695 [Halopseudomonas pelagia]